MNPLTDSQRDIAGSAPALALAAALSARYRRRYRQCGDCIDSAALLGLCEAAARFDPARGVLFTTFARPRVEGCIMDAVGKWLDSRRQRLRPLDAPADSRAPDHPRDRFEYLIRSLPADLRVLMRQRFLLDMTAAEVAAETGASESTVHARFVRCTRSLRARVADLISSGDDVTLSEAMDSIRRGGWFGDFYPLLPEADRAALKDWFLREPGLPNVSARPVPEPSDEPPAVIPITAARASGFTGDVCMKCGGSSMVRSGACLRCNDCGETTGCG